MAYRPPQRPPLAIAFGCSTGGPAALHTVLASLQSNQNVPVFITQHMPANFTPIFANQLNALPQWTVVEARDGMPVHGGTVYLAPGGWHMTARQAKDHTMIELDDTAQEHFCRPSVNPMIRSLLKIYGSRLLIVILTGMGSDGIEACKEAAAMGATIIAQDKETSVVWGMPKAVAEAGICREILPLPDIASTINRYAMKVPA